MKLEEFSNEFDTLIDSYRRFKGYDSKEELDSLEFNEYEKSIFLTKAQKDVVLELYNSKNPFSDTFEKTEEIRRYLSDLVSTKVLTSPSEGYESITQESVFYKLPKDLWFITYESAIISKGSKTKEVIVVPVQQDEFYRIHENPFRKQNFKRVLRLDINDSTVELISDYPISKYKIRYLKEPQPIVLINLPNGLSINNVSVATECKLSETIHSTILDRAVKLALSSKFITKADN